MTLSPVKSIVKVTLLAAFFISLMGNESCDKEDDKLKDLEVPIPQGRYLKYMIDLWPVQAKPIVYCPSDKCNQDNIKQFDFAFASYYQLIDILNKHQRYTLSVSIEEETRTNHLGALMSKNDYEVYSQWLDDVESVVPLATYSNTAPCILNESQFALSTAITSFEVKSSKSGGLKIGFDIGSIFVAPSIGFKHSQSEVQLYMNLYNPIEWKYTSNGNGKKYSNLKSSKGKADHTEVDLKLGLDFSILSFSYGKYWNSGYAEMTKKALKKSAIKMIKKIDKDPNLAWESRVTDNQDGQLVIKGGKLAGIHPCDEFYVFNQKFSWVDKDGNDGKVCQSQLEVIGSSNLNKPDAIVRVTPFQGPGISVVNIVEQSVPKIYPGAKVLVKSLYEGTNDQCYEQHF